MKLFLTDISRGCFTIRHSGPHYSPKQKICYIFSHHVVPMFVKFCVNQINLKCQHCQYCATQVAKLSLVSRILDVFFESISLECSGTAKLETGRR